MKPKVAILRTEPSSVVEDYGRLMRMAGYQEHLARDAVTHLKINMSWQVWYPAGCTTPWQLEGVIKALLDDGYGKESLRLTQNRSLVVDDRVGEVNNGLQAAAERFGLGFTRLDEPPVEWVRHEPRGDMLVLDEICGEGGIGVPDIYLGANMVQLPTMKTHVYAGTDGAMMNAVGGLLQEYPPGDPGVIHEVIVDLLTLQQEIHGGLFAVMDGTFCGDGPGPREIMPYEKDYIMAGADLVALDAVAARMMGFDPMGLAYIRLAHERGLGCGDVAEVEIVGEDISEVDFHFHHQKDRTAGRGLKSASQGILPGMERALMRSPIAPLSYRASNLYHDYFWYPYIGWPRVSRMAETQWGQLLQGYLPEDAKIESQGRGKMKFAAVAGAAALLGMSAMRRVAALARRD